MVRRRAELFLFFCTFIWGSTFVIVKGSFDDISPYLLVVIRFGLATLLLTLIFPKKIRAITRASFVSGAILGFLLYVGFMLQTVALQYTTASKSAFFTSMLVVFTPIVQFVWERKPPTLGNLLGVTLCALGLYLLTSPGESRFNAADGMTLLCAFLFGIYIVYLDIASSRAERFDLFYTQLLVTAICAAICMPFFETPHFSLTPKAILSAGYLTLFATMLSTFIQTRFQGDTTPTRAAVIFTLEPVIAAAAAYFVRGEVLGVIGIVGGIIVVFGLLISEISGEIGILNRAVVPSSEPKV